MTTALRLHSQLGRSEANGPGIRSVIWVQGCTLACEGCFNPQTHPTQTGIPIVEVAEVSSWVCANGVDGLTVSGGEPFEQADAVLELGCLVRSAGLSTVVLTGFTWAELCRTAPEVALRSAFDVVITGRYQQHRHLGVGLRGSTNKQVHLLSPRYTVDDFADTPAAEVVIEPDGTLVLTGIDIPGLRDLT